MATKFTMFFTVAPVYKDGQSYRVAGFSESWFHPSDTIDSVKRDASKLANARAKLLPKQGSIVAFRFQHVTADGRPGASQVRLNYVKGNAAYETDVPNMAYQFRCYAAGKQNRAIRQIKGFPDQFVVDGEAKLDPQMTRDRDAYFKALSDVWTFRGIVMDTPTVDIESITVNGGITTVDDFAYPGDKKKVQIIRTKKDGTRDDFFGQIIRTTTQTNAKNFTVELAKYKGGACTGGRVRAYSHEFFAIEEGIFDQAVYTHKVGRPFFQYRGRASNRA